MPGPRPFAILLIAWLTAAAPGGASSAAQVPPANPVPDTPASVARGRTVYLQNCQSCHDEDGRARSAAVAIAADLTDPSRWKFGRRDPEVFKTIHDGAGDDMPPFRTDLSDAQIWDVVNFLRSLRPPGGPQLRH